MKCMIYWMIRRMMMKSRLDEARHADKLSDERNVEAMEGMMSAMFESMNDMWSSYVERYGRDFKVAVSGFETIFRQFFWTANVLVDRGFAVYDYPFKLLKKVEDILDGGVFSEVWKRDEYSHRSLDALDEVNECLIDLEKYVETLASRVKLR